MGLGSVRTARHESRRTSAGVRKPATSITGVYSFGSSSGLLTPSNRAPAPAAASRAVAIGSVHADVATERIEEGEGSSSADVRACCERG